MNHGLNIILNRRSTRACKQEQIKDDELNSILEAAKFAPSANNEQCWQFTVIQNKDILRRINNACRDIMMKSPNKMVSERAKSEDFSVYYKAPTLFVISAYEKAIAP